MLRLRELQRVIGHNASLMEEFDSKFRDLVQEMTEKERDQIGVRNNHDVDFAYTGTCKHRYDKRKGY